MNQPGRHLNDVEERVLAHIKLYPDLGAWNISRAMGVRKDKVDWTLMELFFRGLIEWEDIPWEGPSRYKRIWRVKSANT